MAGFEPGTLIHQGTLIKSPPENKSKDLGRWKKRHFKLWSNKTLEYFKNEKSERPLRKPIDLTLCKSIDGNLKNKKWDNIFCLNTSYRQFFLVADSPDCMEKWIAKLCEICGFTVQAQGTMEWSSKVKVKPTPGSPTYSKGASSLGMDSVSQASLSKDHTMDSCGLSSSLPSYNEDLPPIPDSPSESSDDLESAGLNYHQAAVGSPYTPGIKQPKSRAYSDSPSSLYDQVPPPRCVEEVTLPSFIRRVSTPSESAERNNEITDESYVDMQPCDAKFVSGSNSLLVNQVSTYDVVPPPRPKDEAGTRKYDHYDVVPSPSSAFDEYIPCEILTNASPKEYPPPVPAQTYNGFDKLPSDENHISDNSRYDVPPGGLDDHTALVSNLHIADPYTSSTPAMQPENGSFDKSYSEGTIRQRPLYDDDSSSSYGKPLGAHDAIHYDKPLSSENQIHDPCDIPSAPIGRHEFCGTSLVQNRESPPQNVYHTPPAPSRTLREGLEDASVDLYRHNIEEIYDTPPVPSRDGREGFRDSLSDRENQHEIYDTPPAPLWSSRKSSGNISSEPYSDSLQEIYDTPPVPRRNDIEEFGNDSSDPYRHNLQEIYDTPPTQNKSNREGFNDTSQSHHKQQEIYDTPPVPNRNDRQRPHDTPPDLYCHNHQKIYDTPPVARQNGSQDFYDFPPTSRNSGTQETLDIPQFQNRVPDMTFEPSADSMYDIPPKSELGNPRSDMLYDFPPKSQRFARQDDIYDVPPMGQSQAMTQPYGTRKGDTTSPADLFNFGFSLSPPAIDRSLKYASTGGIETGRGMPPPIDRKTRPVLATSVPIFPSDFQSNTLKDTHVDNLYQSSVPQHEGFQTRKQRP